MKDILEYTKEELEQLSTEELQNLLKETELQVNLYNTKQLVEKTLMNSLYGALANKYFPLFNEDMAAAITGNGRYFIRKLSKYLEEALQSMIPSENEYVIYNDTDSVYIQVHEFVNRYIQKNNPKDLNEIVDWVDKFVEKAIDVIIQKTINDFCDELNAYNREVIGAKREVIADAGVFSAKKKYFLRVYDDEGTRYPIDLPYYKIQGLEVIKSSTPTWCKKYLIEAIPHILDKDEADLKQWVREIKQKYVEADLNDIASVGSVSRLDYDLEKDKGVPIGSRAAIKHNIYIEKYKLTNKYQHIKPGDKCKRLFLIEPNPFETNIIAYTNDTFVEEIKKHNCVDYDTQFEKTFLAALELMVESLNYNMKLETQSLDDW